MINRVMLTGNLTRDCEVRQTAGGMAIGSFGIAVNDRRKNGQTGEWEDYPNFFDCTLFGTKAEKLSQYLTKGAKVAIEGRLHYSSWESNGQKRSKTDVTVDSVEFMSKRDATYVERTTGHRATKRELIEAAGPSANYASSYVYDDDIPF